ncbi:MAG TPA: protein kinase [Bacteroidota bacterium]|jgi:serine/threonine protein kinase/tetratricopeptide (TPR) repeat protein
MIGQTISHYKILEKLGEGGMGVVYKAEDLKLRRTVAVKFLPKRLSIHDEERARFTLEAQAASALNHPNISTIYEIDEANGETFIVMEYIPGVTLREWIRRKSEETGGYRKTGLKESVDIAIQIAEGLEKAHEKGIVHRDIKSENVMVTDDDRRAKIMDFGLAKLGGVSKLTKTGSTVGTIAYMSPEQVEGTETDHRTDIFSFGVLCYEMFTGQLPFRAGHETAVMYEIINVEPAPLVDPGKGIDAELDRIVMKCLEKNREDRYQSMREVSVDLRRYNRDSVGKRIERSSSALDASPSHPSPPQRKGFPVWAIAAVLAVLLGGGAWYYLTHRSSSLDSLAVLPFVNVTTDPEKEYLTEGITENIINKLSQLSGLRVIPRSMVARYKGKDFDPREAGKELNVSAVLTGKVVQRGDELTIQTELIDVQNVSQLWGEQYNRKLSDVITVEEDIIRKLSEKLQTKATSDEKKQLSTGRPADPEAYQLYLKGRFYWNKRTDEANSKAIDFFHEAIKRDPGYALAYAGLADCYLVLGGPIDMPKVRDAAMKALELDDNLAEVHNSLAAEYAYFEFDFVNAEKEYRRAISLNPNYPTAHHWLGEFLIFLGRFDEGLAEYNRAVELDPASLAIASDLGIGYFFARQYDKSIEQLKKTIEMDPHFVRTHYYLAQPYLQKGMPDAAFDELVKGMVADGDSAKLIEDARQTYTRSGFKGLARMQLDRGVQFSNFEGLFSVARNRAVAGDRELALSELERAYELHDNVVVTIKTDPVWDAFRNETRFIALMKKLGFEK